MQRISAGAAVRFSMENTEIFRGAEPQYHAFAGITGYQLYIWYRDHKYSRTLRAPSGTGQKRENAAVRRMRKYGLSQDLSRSDHRSDRWQQDTDVKICRRTYKKYALLAGFAEIGETLEQTVKREVMEEVGLKVKNIRYYKSQPWSFSDTLLTGILL